MSNHVEDLICYRADGQLFASQKEAEAAALDAFGTELNAILKNAKHNRVQELAWGVVTVPLVEALWSNRAVLPSLLDSRGAYREGWACDTAEELETLLD